MVKKKTFFKFQIVALLVLVLALMFFIPKTPVYAETRAEQTKFNLAEEITIPSKNQRTYELCWAFASARSIETFLLVNFNQTIDISESWASLAYYNYVRDEENSLDQDDITGYKYGGAGHFLSFQHAINAYGIVSETNLPYNTSFNNFIDNDDEESDEYINAFNHYKQFSTKNVRKIEFDWIGNIKNEETKKPLEEIIELAKIYITTWGSIYSQVNMGDLKYNYTNNTSVMNSKSLKTDHAITIVGWDDTYTYGGKTGAFVVMNSHGSSNEFFYVMYDDNHILTQARYIKSMMYNNKITRVSLDYYDSEKIVTVIAIAGGTLILMVVPPSILYAVKKENWREM